MISLKQIFLISILFMLSACGARSNLTTLPDPVPDQHKSPSAEGVSLDLPKTTFYESPVEIITTIRNHSDDEFTIGDFYHIEVTKDNAWYIITYSDKIFFENRRFKDYGRTLYANSEMKQTFSVEALGLTLPPGDYRLVKSFSPKTGTYYKISLAVPFSIK